jgi:hypothetical protein
MVKTFSRPFPTVFIPKWDAWEALLGIERPELGGVDRAVHHDVTHSMPSSILSLQVLMV